MKHYLQYFKQNFFNKYKWFSKIGQFVYVQYSYDLYLNFKYPCFFLKERENDGSFQLCIFLNFIIYLFIILFDNSFHFTKCFRSSIYLYIERVYQKRINNYYFFLFLLQRWLYFYYLEVVYTDLYRERDRERVYQ